MAERLQQVKSQLPTGLEPEMGPIATGLGEIFMYTVEAEPEARKPDGTPWTPTDLRTLQDWVVRPQLRNTPGVTEVNTIGGFERQIHITPDPARLVALGFTLHDVVAAVAANNQNVGAGYIERNGQQFLVRVPGQVADLDGDPRHRARPPRRRADPRARCRRRRRRPGAAHRRGDAERPRGRARHGLHAGRRQQPRRVAQAAARQAAKPPTPACRAGVRAKPVYDRTALVDRTIATVATNLVEGALLVIVVLFLLLGNFRAALITAAVIPLSMLFTVTGMVRGGVSGNLMSLGALDFGLIVDGAVIIIENCLRRFGEVQRRARPRADARGALRADRHGHRRGDPAQPVRRRHHHRGVSADLRAHRHRGKDVPPDGDHRGAGADRRDAAVADLRAGGDRAVPRRPRRGEGEPRDAVGAHDAMRRCWPGRCGSGRAVIGGALVLVVLCGLLATRLGTEFIPNLDEGDIAVHALRIPGTSLTQAVQHAGGAGDALAQFPEVERVFSKLGTAEVANDPMPPSVTDTFVMLKPRDALARSAQAQGRAAGGNRSRGQRSCPATTTSSPSRSRCA